VVMHDRSLAGPASWSVPHEPVRRARHRNAGMPAGPAGKADEPRTRKEHEPCEPSCLACRLLRVASHLQERCRELAGLGGTEAVVLTVDADRVPEVPPRVDLLSLIEPNVHLERDAVVIAVLGLHDDFWPFMPEVIRSVQQPVLKMPTPGDAPRWARLVVVPTVVG
jgi:hypothetical protein